MNKEWREVKLGEILNFRRGHDLPKTKMIDKGIPVVGSNGIIGFHNEVTTKAPCVSIGRSGNVGNPRITNTDCWAHNTTLYIDDFKGNDPFYIYYFLTTLNLKNYRGGSAVPTLNRNHIHPILTKIPPLPEQKAIAHILGKLDDKIELNRQMNQSLEQMAQALFQSWFVDFDPVLDNAITQGNEIPEALHTKAEKRNLVALEKKLAHTNPKLAAQFPSSFVYNETLAKWIPEGWEVKKIGELSKKIQNGGTPKRDNEDYWKNGNIPWLSSGEVRQNIICNTNSFITEVGLKNSSAKWVDAFSTVVAMYGATAGQVAIISQPFTTNQAVCSLLPKEKYEFFNYLNLSNQVLHLENQARGSAQQNISKGIIELINVVVPSAVILNEFHSIVMGSFQKHISNIKQTETLTKLRDTLLPQLISGKLKVPEALLQIEKEL